MRDVTYEWSVIKKTRTENHTNKQTNKLTLDENCFVASPPVRPLLLKLSLIGLVQIFVTGDDVRSGADP